MAAAYTHYCFGKDVLKRLPKEIRQDLLKHRNAYMVGQQGPDILFFYQPLMIKNHICQKGLRMHRRYGRELTERARIIYKQYHNQEFRAYYMGFLCHFMLDSTVHRYIHEAMYKYDVSHADIEAHVDRYLMARDEKNYFFLNPFAYMKSTDSLCDAVSPFFGLSPAVINKSILSAIHYKHYLLYNMGIVSSIANGLLIMAGVYKKVRGFWGFKSDNPRCQRTTVEMLELYDSILDETAEILTFCYYNLDNNLALPARLDRNFED